MGNWNRHRLGKKIIFIKKKLAQLFPHLFFLLNIQKQHTESIEKGRHRKIDLENRLCPLCKFEVEDELHFTIKCTKLQELRNKFYQKISDILPSFYNLSDTEKFHLIFRSNDYDVSSIYVVTKSYLRWCYRK
jgi:hypothetical protein